MDYEQHEMIVTKEKFLIFRQLRVRDLETTERFLLYGKSAKGYHSFFQSQEVATKIDPCRKIHR